jgi:hypothetical protein
VAALEAGPAIPDHGAHQAAALGPAPVGGEAAIDRRAPIEQPAALGTAALLRRALHD